MRIRKRSGVVAAAMPNVLIPEGFALDPYDEPIDWEEAIEIVEESSAQPQAESNAQPQAESNAQPQVEHSLELAAAAATPPPQLIVSAAELSLSALEGCDFIAASTENVLNTYKLDQTREAQLREYESKWPGVLSRHGCPLCNANFSSTCEFMIRYQALLKEPLSSSPPTVCVFLCPYHCVVVLAEPCWC